MSLGPVRLQFAAWMEQALAKLEEDFNTDVQRIHLSKITPILSVSDTAIANSYR